VPVSEWHEDPPCLWHRPAVGFPSAAEVSTRLDGLLERCDSVPIAEPAAGAAAPAGGARFRRLSPLPSTSSVLRPPEAFLRSSAGAVGPHPLMIVATYQDSLTRFWAKQVYECWMQSLGAERVSGRFWRIEDLTHQSILLEAVAAAVQADVILVSAHAAEQMPLSLYAWIDAWLPRRRQRGGTLVSLMDITGSSLSVVTRVRCYLQAVANRARLGFLEEERKLPLGCSHCNAVAQITERVQTTTQVLAAFLTRDSLPHPHAWQLP
jgi:hypothetical protein